MFRTKLERFYPSMQTFNITPIIDIVFLLIIFFLVVCQFIEAENFPVSVPDSCHFAKDSTQPTTMITTLTVMKSDKSNVQFAVGSEKVDATNYESIVEKLTHLIDNKVKNLPPAQRVVNLRIDKDICFSDAQYALAAVAASTATDIRLAALKENRNN